MLQIVLKSADADAIALLCRDPSPDPQTLAGRILDASDGAAPGDDRTVLVVTLSAAE